MACLDPETVRKIKELHSSFLRENEYDEGDLIFYRINYRLADMLEISNEEAQALHAQYHDENPRRVSEGLCDKCDKVVSVIPIIYGIQKSDLPDMQAREREGRLIIGDTRIIREGTKVSMFGCKECKHPLPKYGTL